MRKSYYRMHETPGLGGKSGGFGWGGPIVRDASAIFVLQNAKSALSLLP